MCSKKEASGPAPLFLSNHAVAPASPPQPHSFRFDVHHSTAAPGTKTPRTKAVPHPGIQSPSCQGSLLETSSPKGFSHPTFKRKKKKHLASYKMLMPSCLQDTVLLPCVSWSVEPWFPFSRAHPACLILTHRPSSSDGSPSHLLSRAFALFLPMSPPPPLAVPAHIWVAKLRICIHRET